MGESGLVLSTKNNMVTVKLKRTEACAKCRACIAGLNSKEMIMEAQNLCNASVGDYVEIELKDGYFIRAALIMYGIPLFVLISGIFIGSFFWGDIAGLLLGLILTLLSYLLIKKNEKKYIKKEFIPMAVSITGKNVQNQEPVSNEAAK